MQERLSEAEEAARQKLEGLKVHKEDELGGVGGGGEKVTVVNVEETRPGHVASVLKAADQMTGQTFNDVGRIDDEGSIIIDRGSEDRQDKM